MGYTILCAQYGTTAAWHHTPALKTNADIIKFADDGWRAANIWIVRDLEGASALAEVGGAK